MPPPGSQNEAHVADLAGWRSLNRVALAAGTIPNRRDAEAKQQDRGSQRDEGPIVPLDDDGEPIPEIVASGPGDRFHEDSDEHCDPAEARHDDQDGETASTRTATAMNASFADRLASRWQESMGLAGAAERPDPRAGSR